MAVSSISIALMIGIILTSPRSAESVNQAMADLLCAWKEMRHYCVGVKTGETAVNLLGLKNLVGQNCGNAENLSSLIVKGTTRNIEHTY